MNASTRATDHQYLDSEQVRRNYLPGSEKERKFELRSCIKKIRYSIEPSVTMNLYAYHCRFCGGWHKATKKEEK